MPELGALTFDIGMNTAEFERGAQNVDAMLRQLLGGAFQQFAQAVEGIAQNLLGVTNAGGDMSTALTQSGQEAARALQTVNDSTKDVERQTQSSANRTATLWEGAARRIEFSMKTAFRSFIGPMAAIFGIQRMFSQYTSTADRLGKFAKDFDPSLKVADIQAWSEATIRQGGSAEAFQGTVQMLNRQMQMFGVKGKKGASMGGGFIKSILDDLKIKPTENGKVKDVFKLMTEISGVAEKMDKTKFNGLMSRLRVDRGTMRLLRMGRSEMEKLIERQKALGGVTEQDTEIAANFNNAIADLAQVFKAFAAVIMRTVTPMLTALSNSLTWLFVKINEHQELLKALVVFMIGPLSGRAFSLVHRWIGRLVTAIVTGAPKIISSITAIKFSVASLKTVVAGLWALFGGFVIEDIFGYFTGKASLTGAIVYKVKGWGKKFHAWCEELDAWIRNKITALRDFFRNKLTGWMPDSLKKMLGLMERTPEEEKVHQEAEEYQRLQAKENPGGIPESAEVANERWERAKKNVAERAEKEKDPATPEFQKRHVQRVNDLYWELLRADNNGDMADVDALRKQAEKEIAELEAKEAAAWSSAPKAVTGDVGIEKAKAPAGIGADALKNSAIADDAFGNNALGVLSQISDNLKIAVSQSAAEAIEPVVNDQREVKIDVQQNVTQNVSTNDPQGLADGVVAPMKDKAKGAWGGVLNWLNSGQNNVGGGTVYSELKSGT